MKKLFLAAVLGLNVLIQASAMEIQDPNNIMSYIEMFAEAREFNYEFKVGDMVEVESNSCWVVYDGNGEEEESGCDTHYKTIKVEKVTENHAEYSSNYAITKKLYNKIKDNPFKLLIEYEEFSSLLVKENMDEERSILTLTEATEDYSYLLGVNTLKIKFVISFEDENGSFALPMYLVLAQQLPIAGQIAEFGLDKDLMDLPSIWEPSLKVVDWLKFI